MRLYRRPHSALVWVSILLGIFLIVPVIGLVQFRTSSATLPTNGNILSSKNPQFLQSPSDVRTISAESNNSSSQNAQLTPLSPVTYHGGSVQLSEYVYAIFWLPIGDHFEPSGNDSQFESLISRYFDDFSGSNLSQMLVQYPDDVSSSPTTNVTFGGGFVDTAPYPAAGTVADPLLGSDISNEIETVISSGSLPTGIDDSYYVFTASGINVCEDQGMTLCTFPTSAQSSGFCAYHSYQDSSPYAVLPVDPSGITGGCQITSAQIGTSTFPNGDSIADSEINLVSQEQFDMATDPLLTSWYNNASSTEVSNQCAGQFGNVNTTDGSNIAMNGNLYILQEEWSNAAGGCTLTPPNYASIQVTLVSSVGSNSLSTTNYYPLSYEIGRQLMTLQYVSGPITIQADPNTSLTIASMSSSSDSGSEKWCLDASCQGDVIALGSGSSTTILSYYDNLDQNVYELTSDNSKPTSFASITYLTAPSTMGFGLPDASQTLNLTSTSQYIWVQRGSNASITSESYTGANGTERWINAGNSWNISQPFEIPLVISYDQYLMTFDYSVVPSGETGLTGPTVTFVSEGMTNSTVAPETVWADAGSSYSYGNLLGSSSGSERWVSVAGSGAGKVTSAATVENTYYNQYPVSVLYSVAGRGGNGSGAPAFTGTSLGSSLTVTLKTTPSTYWLDSGSNYTVTNLLPGSNSTDRWITTSNGTGTVISQLSLDFYYYHQFTLNFSYNIVGGGTPPELPVVNFSSFNNTLSYGLSNIPPSVWVNAGSELNVSSAMTSPNSTQRWAYSAESEAVSYPGSFEITLYHQFEVGFSVALKGGGTPTTQPQISAISFGKPITLEVTSPSNSGNSTNSSNFATTAWLDAGSSYSFPSSLGNSSSERWLSPSAPTGVINSALNVSVTYYNQYLITLAYTVTNGADTSGGPTASVSLFGISESVVVNQTSGQVWADGGTAVSLPSQLPGSNSGERWATNSTVTGTVAPGLSLTPSYDHQFMFSLNTNPTGIPVAMSEQSGWYDAGSSQVVTLITGRGWQFESWTGQGVGSYSGTVSGLILTLSSPITETANFYTALTITAPSTGSVTYSFANVTGSVPQGQSKVVYVPPGQMLSTSASPFPVFYAFSSWTGNITGGPNATTIARNPITFSMSSPASLNVSFKINLLGIILVVVVVVVAIASVLMVRRRNRPPEEEYYGEESGGQTVENMEGEST